MEKRYVYFVSGWYKFAEHWGIQTMEASTDRKIDTMEQIRELEKKMGNELGHEYIISNFQLLRVEEK